MEMCGEVGPGGGGCKQFFNSRTQKEKFRIIYRAAGLKEFTLGKEQSNAQLQGGGITPEQKFPGSKKFPGVKSTQPPLPGTRPGSGTTPRNGGGALGGFLIGVAPLLADIYCGAAENPNEWVCGHNLPGGTWTDPPSEMPPGSPPIIM